MKKFVPFFYLLIVIITLLSLKCRKDKALPRTYYIPQIMKDWGYFISGTYWIYEDSASMVLDSIYVTSSEIKIEDQEYRGEIARRIETYYVNSISALYGNKYTDIGSYPSSPQNCKPDEKCHLITRINSISSEAVTHLLYLPPYVGLTGGANGLTVVTLTAIYDSLQINGKIFLQRSTDG